MLAHGVCYGFPEEFHNVVIIACQHTTPDLLKAIRVLWTVLRKVPKWALSKWLSMVMDSLLYDTFHFELNSFCDATIKSKDRNITRHRSSLLTLHFYILVRYSCDR